MQDDLYETDILAWSRTQAERLRRVAAGERVNDVDWTHVIEEVEDLGKSELNAVRANFQLALLHALKTFAWPEHRDLDHWVQEIATFLTNARNRFQPGMAQNVDVPAIYRRAVKDIRRLPMSGILPKPLPDIVALTVDELANEDFGTADLLDRIRAALPAG